MGKSEAKEKILQLIWKYEQLTSLEKKNYNEANTRKNFILPMFEALGWDIHDDIVEEDPSICGRVDYAFRVNHLTQFLLEAKSLSENLDKEKWAKQTVEYGWNMGVPWVVLSDFEGLKLFNSEETTDRPRERFDFKYTEYIEKFDSLWLLSKESFEQNLLDKTLSNFGIGQKRIKVNELLASDLVRWRDKLSENLKSWNADVEPLLLNQSIQRILDRLIFIRVIEDKRIEDKFLWQIFQKWQTNSFNPNNFIELLIPLFRKFDQIYNSNLFQEHFCEKLDTEGDPFKQIIPELYYNKEQQVSYRFDAINADVLGKVYEQYLGYIQKGIKDEGKRKRQGIYYTPSYIVDYIVRNTIEKKISELINLNDKQSIKILDPACGSGSFLINSFDYLDQCFKKENNQKVDDDIAAIRKYRILQENIYGVDLDDQAIEIAKLNLLLQAVVPNFKLPILSKHIHVGNSLIEDKNITEKAFDWKKEFEDVFNRKNPGFDVIIGNPPYIKEYINKEAFNNLHDNPYYQGKMDLWTLFACKAIDLLRNGGYLSFIAPNNWVSNAGASIFRDKILNEGEILSYIDFGDYKVFSDAGIQTMIFVFKKCKPREKYNVEYLKIENSNSSESEVIKAIQQKKTNIQIEKEKLIGSNITFYNKENNVILEKMISRANFYLEKNEIAQGIVCPQENVIKSHLSLVKNLNLNEGIFVVSDNEKQGMNLTPDELNLLKPYYSSKEIERYFTKLNNKYWIFYLKSDINKKIEKFPNIKKHLDKFRDIITSDFKPYGLHRARNEKFFNNEKIISIRKSDKPKFSYNNFPCYVSQTFNIIQSDRINLKYFTAVLNSTLIKFWFKNKGKMQGDIFQIDREPLLKVPIYIPNNSKQKEIINFVDEIIKLRTKINSIPINSDQYRNLERETMKIEKEIDQIVYKIYGLKEEEIKILEDSLK